MIVQNEIRRLVKSSPGIAGMYFEWNAEFGESWRRGGREKEAGRDHNRQTVSPAVVQEDTKPDTRNPEEEVEEKGKRGTFVKS